MSDIDRPPEPAPRADLGQGPAPAPTSTPAASGFDLNHPTIVSLLYLSSLVLGVTAVVGVVLAYIWKDGEHAEWERSHFQYLIRTFWIGLIGSAISIALMLVLIGFLLLFAVAVLVIVRSVLSLVNAQKRQPMPNPESLFI